MNYLNGKDVKGEKEEKQYLLQCGAGIPNLSYPGHGARMGNVDEERIAIGFHPSPFPIL